MSKKSRTHNMTRWARRCRQRNRAEAFRLRGGSYVLHAPETKPDPVMLAASMAAGKVRRGSTRRGES